MKCKILSLLAVFAFAETAFSFPENTRLGYSSCTSCHVDPTGGGVLNAYGRSSAAEYLAMVSGKPKDGEDGDKWGSVGADIRTVHVKQDDSAGDTRITRLLMQAEVQAAGYLSDQITVAGSYGAYGQPLDKLKKSKFQASSYFVMLKPQPYYVLRVGQFTPAYGLKIADHTASIRGVFQPASQSQKQGAEADVLLQQGEVNLGGFVDQGVDYVALRGALYLGKNNQVGASYYGSATKGYRAGGFAIGALGGTYALLEVDYDVTIDGGSFIGYSKVAQELVKGVHVYTTNDKVWKPKGTRPNRYSLGVQWFPFPHYETSFEIKNYELPLERSYVLMTHFYF